MLLFVVGFGGKKGATDLFAIWVFLIGFFFFLGFRLCENRAKKIGFTRIS